MARRRRKRRSGVINIILLIGIVVLASMGGLAWFGGAQGAVDTSDSREIYVDIAQGSSTQSIAEALYQHGLIRSELVFAWISRTHGYDGQYQSGAFTFSRNMDMATIMDILKTGSNNLAKITIPEGFSQEQIKNRLVSEGVLTAESFDDAVKNGAFDYPFLEGIDRDEYGLEGYLFPKTYMMNKNANANEVVNRLLRQFDTEVTEDLYARAEEIGMSMNDAVILASIIEKEAVVPEDRPVISGVFHNRLKIDMKLQSCATVQFALGEVKPRLTIKDTQIDSPYNTYLITGLPPAPICSPRLESIQVALYPEQTDYLFFVAKGDGSHAFARTNAEHEANKRKYQ